LVALPTSSLPSPPLRLFFIRSVSLFRIAVPMSWALHQINSIPQSTVICTELVKLVLPIYPATKAGPEEGKHPVWHHIFVLSHILEPESFKTLSKRPEEYMRFAKWYVNSPPWEEQSPALSPPLAFRSPCGGRGPAWRGLRRSRQAIPPSYPKKGIDKATEPSRHASRRAFLRRPLPGFAKRVIGLPPGSSNRRPEIQGR
jgi:hypothetical protein